MLFFHGQPASILTGSIAMALEPRDAIAETSSPGKKTLSVNKNTPDLSTATQSSQEEQNQLSEKENINKEKEKFLARREKQLLALQKEINKKIEALTQLRNEIRGELAKKKIAQENQVKHLIKIYSNMKPQKVAALVKEMDINLAIALFSRMKGEVVGKILSFLDPTIGAKITQGLFPIDLKKN